MSEDKKAEKLLRWDELTAIQKANRLAAAELSDLKKIVRAEQQKKGKKKG